MVMNDKHSLSELNSSKKIYSLLGLAQRGRNVASGEYMTECSVKEGKAELVIVAADASENTKKKFQNMCSFYHVPIAILGTKEELGHAIGKEMRASIAVTDPGLAGAMQKQIDDSINNGR